MEGGAQAVALELAQLGGDKWLHSKGPTGSGSGRQAPGSETSDRARKGQVEAGDKWLRLNGRGWASDRAREVMIDKQSG